MLLADREERIRSTAAASLLVLLPPGDPAGAAPRQLLLGLLQDGQPWQVKSVLAELRRLDGGRLAFAQAALLALTGPAPARRLAFDHWDHQLVRELLAKPPVPPADTP